MYSQGMYGNIIFRINIPCDQCHRAELGMKCVFCSGTKVAGILLDDRQNYEKALVTLGEKVIESWESEVVDGKVVKRNVRGPKIACSGLGAACSNGEMRPKSV